MKGRNLCQAIKSCLWFARICVNTISRTFACHCFSKALSFSIQHKDSSDRYFLHKKMANFPRQIVGEGRHTSTTPALTNPPGTLPAPHFYYDDGKTCPPLNETTIDPAILSGTDSDITLECMEGRWVRVRTIYLDVSPAEYFTETFGEVVLALVAEGTVPGAYDAAFAYPAARGYYVLHWAFTMVFGTLCLLSVIKVRIVSDLDVASIARASGISLWIPVRNIGFVI